MLYFLFVVFFSSFLSVNAADIVNSKGEIIGYVSLNQKGSGLLLKLTLQGLATGWHAIHIHEKGYCDDFEDGFIQSGGHFNPNKYNHGVFDESGYHAGDLANIYVDKSGSAHVEQIIPRMTPDSYINYFPDHGPALIIHAGPDDYTSQPAGDAGVRVACSVLPILSSEKSS